MSLIRKLTPINLLEEKEKFFADQSYNPQFIYEHPVSEAKLLKHGIPQKKYLSLAKEILDQTYYGRNEADLYHMKGKQLKQKEITKKIKTYLKMHGMEKRFKIVWSSSYVVRTTITPGTVKLRLPVSFRKEDLLGMLYHEIGTHAVRRVNYEQQPWYKQKKKYGFKNYLRTEEGLATLHSLIPHSFKAAFISAIRYLAVHWAQQESFAQLWRKLGRYIQDPERRWIITLRQKRGMTDTSKPGGFTKDLVYFEGLVDVYQYLKENDFNITKLYFGKMALEDVEKAVQMNPNYKPLLPSFFVLDNKTYKKNLKEIGSVNGLK